LFSFLSYGEDDIICISPDGKKLTPYKFGITGWFNSVAYGLGQFVAVGENGTIISSNDDRVNTTRDAAVRRDEKNFSANYTKNGILAHIPSAYASAPVSIRIYSISGRMVYSADRNISNVELNIPSRGFTPGTYLMSVSSQGRKIGTQRVVVTR
jgi:hypothetical protein